MDGFTACPEARPHTTSAPTPAKNRSTKAASIQRKGFKPSGTAQTDM